MEQGETLAVMGDHEGAEEAVLVGLDGGDPGAMNDYGVFLRDRISEEFRPANVPVNVRYIDPSYFIRGLAANTEDAILSDILARDAVHAAFAGRTGLMIGTLHNRPIHVPLEMATESRKTVDLRGELWQAVLAVTGQTSFRN